MIKGAILGIAFCFTSLTYTMCLAFEHGSHFCIPVCAKFTLRGFFMTVEKLNFAGYYLRYLIVKWQSYWKNRRAD
jgi:hypothetical protein